MFISCLAGIPAEIYETIKPFKMNSKRHFFTKVLILKCLVCLFAFNGIAQSHNIGIAPLGFVNKVRGKYEFAFHENLSVGSIISVYYPVDLKNLSSKDNYPINDFRGPRMDVFGRIYIMNNAEAQGLYLQPKFSTAYFQSNMELIAVKEGNSGEYISSEQAELVSFFSWGGGISVGYQFRLGDLFFLDIQSGVQNMKYIDEDYTKEIGDMKYHLKQNVNRETFSSDDYDPKKWKWLGPGALWQNVVTIGIVF